MRLPTLLVTLALLIPSAAASVSAPEARGPHATWQRTFHIVRPPDPRGPDGLQPLLQVDVWVPEGPGPFPLVALSPPGANKDAIRGYAERLASHGHVALLVDRRGSVVDDGTDIADQAARDAGVPGLHLWDERGAAGEGTLLSLVDPRVAADDVVAALSWALRESLRQGSPLAGKVDPARIGLFGYSQGGQVALLAEVAASRAGIQPEALVLLDPGNVALAGDEADARAQARAVTTPTLVLLSEQDRQRVVDCEEDAGCLLVGRAILRALPAQTPRWGLKVEGLGHFDAGDAGPVACTHFLLDPLLGHDEPCEDEYFAQARLPQRYTFAFFDLLLQCERGMRTWFGGDAGMDDVQAGRTSLVDGDSKLRPSDALCPA